MSHAVAEYKFLSSGENRMCFIFTPTMRVWCLWLWRTVPLELSEYQHSLVVNDVPQKSVQWFPCSFLRHYLKLFHLEALGAVERFDPVFQAIDSNLLTADVIHNRIPYTWFHFLDSHLSIAALQHPVGKHLMQHRKCRRQKATVSREWCALNDYIQIAFVLLPLERHLDGSPGPQSSWYGETLMPSYVTWVQWCSN